MDQRRDRYIIKLLLHQNSDGSFSFTAEAENELLGTLFVEAITNIEIRLREVAIEPRPSRRLSSRVRKWRTVAMAAAIIALLRTEFPSKRSLWELMAAKALDFIRSLSRGFNDQVLAIAESEVAGKTKQWLRGTVVDTPAPAQMQNNRGAPSPFISPWTAGAAPSQADRQREESEKKRRTQSRRGKAGATETFRTTATTKSAGAETTGFDEQAGEKDLTGIRPSGYCLDRYNTQRWKLL